MSPIDRWSKAVRVSMRWHLIATSVHTPPDRRLHARMMACVMMDRVLTRAPGQRKHLLR